MSIVSNYQLQQALTVSVAKRQREISNIVYNATPLTRILKNEGRIKEKRGGGPELRIPVQFDKLTATWFTGYDYIPITPKELLNTATWNWSRVVSMFSLNGTEMMYNSGQEEIIDLLELYQGAAEQGVKEEFERSLFGDGTAQGGRQMVGFGGAIPITPNVGTYGGIDRVAVPNWRTSTFNVPNGDVTGYTTWDAATARQIVEQITLARSRGGNYPDLLICDSKSYQAISDACVQIQRFVSERVASLGFSGFSINTAAGSVDVVAAGGLSNYMPANTAFGIDTKSLSIYNYPGQEFVPFHSGGPMSPINQDAIAQGIVWSGQLVLENPLFTYRLITA